MKYRLIFDEVIIKQLKKIAKNNQIKEILSKILNKLELIGPDAGKLIDSQLFLYEIKNNKPAIRLYYRHNYDEIHVFKFEIKKSQEKQQKTIEKIKKKLKS